MLTLVRPTPRSNKTKPSFSGTASENTEVVVHVFEGPTEVANAKTTASAGAWSTSGLSKALPSGHHTFTVSAREKSALAGNPEGKAGPLTFEVNTLPPEVTIGQPVTPSNNTNPAFSGTASEESEVEVRVFEGTNEVAHATTTAFGGQWATGSLSNLLPAGKRTFTAHATEKSLLGNAAGKSSTVSFEVNTLPPEVTLNQPTTPSNNTNPSFSGTASEETPVTVHVLEGTTELTSVTTTPSGGTWSAALPGVLPAGKHVFNVVATEKSGIGNADGRSQELQFEVNTEAPVVTLEQPAPVSNVTTPAFSGTASETKSVTVEVFRVVNEQAETKPSAKLSTPVSKGKWETAHL